MTDGGLSLTLTFTFDAQGLIESVRADARGRTEGGKIVMRPGCCRPKRVGASLIGVERSAH